MGAFVHQKMKSTRPNTFWQRKTEKNIEGKTHFSKKKRNKQKTILNVNLMSDKLV